MDEQGSLQGREQIRLTLDAPAAVSRVRVRCCVVMSSQIRMLCASHSQAVSASFLLPTYSSLCKRVRQEPTRKPNFQDEHTRGSPPHQHSTTTICPARRAASKQQAHLALCQHPLRASRHPRPASACPTASARSTSARRAVTSLTSLETTIPSPASSAGTLKMLSVRLRCFSALPWCRGAASLGWTPD